MNAQETFEANLLKLIAKERKNPKSNNPGLPWGQINPAERIDLDEAIKRGVVRIVKRPRVTNPSKLASFIVEASFIDEA